MIQKRTGLIDSNGWNNMMQSMLERIKSTKIRSSSILVFTAAVFPV